MADWMTALWGDSMAEKMAAWLAHQKEMYSVLLKVHWMESQWVRYLAASLAVEKDP